MCPIRTVAVPAHNVLGTSTGRLTIDSYLIKLFSSRDYTSDKVEDCDKWKWIVIWKDVILAYFEMFFRHSRVGA